MQSIERSGTDRERQLKERKKQQMIARFKAFNERTAVYRARKKAAVTKTRIDLTRRRLRILREAKTLAEEHKDKIDLLLTLIAALLRN